MRLRPTELGVKGGLLVGALGCAFFATGYSNLFFLLLVFVVVLGVLGAVWSLTNLRGLTLRMAEPPLAEAGRPRSLRLELGLPRAHATAFDLAVGLELGGSCHELLHVPMAQAGEILTVTLPGLPRGRIGSWRWHLRSRHPFGLWRVVRTLPGTLPIHTYPRPESGSGVGRARQSAGGAVLPLAAASAAMPEDGAGLRPFQPGDSMRRVHWRATARRGEPVVREDARPNDPAAVVWVDRHCSAEALEPRLSLAAAAVLAARRSRRPITVQSQGVTLVGDGSTASSDALLRWLAAAQPWTDAADPPIEQRPAAGERQFGEAGHG
ncbi:MAG: DUF58 domain-containing protein [Planctomycetes bacterium]|nr:DUF58 domain-containing protein [Planctomycetota bacterium]